MIAAKPRPPLPCPLSFIAIPLRSLPLSRHIATKPNRNSQLVHSRIGSSLYLHSYQQNTNSLQLSPTDSLCFLQLPNSLREQPRRHDPSVPKSLLTYSRKSLYLNSLAFCYLQCSQQNTNSLQLFAIDSLSFHQLMNSLRKNTRG